MTSRSLAARELDPQDTRFAGVLILLLAGLILAALGWTAWAAVEEVVVAPGRVEPLGRVKLVNHPRGGRVVQLFVNEGEAVVRGQPLLRLEADLSEGERAELQQRWQIKAVEVARLSAEAEGTSYEVAEALAKVRPDLVEAERQFMEARAAARIQQQSTLERQVQARRGDVRTAAAEVARLQNGLVLLRQQLAAVRELADRGLYPKLKLVEVERQVGDTEASLAKAQAEVAATEAALAESESRRDGGIKDERREILAELAGARGERDALAEQLAAHTQLVDSLLITAPSNGIVEELAVAAIGQAVAPNEPILRLVPSDEGLIVTATVANDDIGRLRPGLPARLKVHTFDYLRHGTLDGEVVKIAADATLRAATGDLAYDMRVAPSRAYVGDDREGLALAPGMRVDVEVIVGERTILSYLTDRVWRLRDNAFREG